jgi:hypothetical protein
MSKKATTHKRIKIKDVMELEQDKRKMEQELGIKLSDPEFFTLYIKRAKKKNRGESLFEI